MDSLPSEAALDEFRLLSGRYYFSELEGTDSVDLLDSLKEKYGNPQEKNGANDSTYYEWVTERSLIVFNGENYLAYHTIYGPVKKYGKVNSAKSNDDDL
ncbi:hypothetical protein [Cohnella hashimotonis]|uniref:Uncharacterized protein n=1 Tax=Cohnella hashimotonis TaxID=2826895 RepID=A0ABT6T9Y2_9BACL|nr:hypothetical protein [Cohnella hashimotonis]MDI4643641.1 hypothetical protein [Cohnella hashimotonis]